MGARASEATGVAAAAAATPKRSRRTAALERTGASLLHLRLLRFMFAALYVGIKKGTHAESLLMKIIGAKPMAEPH